MITQKRFLIAKLDERGLILFIRGMAKLADAPVVHTGGGGTPYRFESYCRALYMGQTTNGELGLTANQNVLVFQVLESYSSCPALYIDAPIGTGFEVVPDISFSGRIGNAASYFRE